MSVAAQLELADPERDLLARARGQWTVWSERCPRLRVVDDLLNLPAWIAAADKGEVDRVLWELARLASPSGGDDVAAAGALAWLLLPGACATAHRLRSLTPRIDEVVAAQLWLEVREFPWQRLGKVAANIVMNVRRGVLRELGVGSHLEEVDPAWSRAVPLPPEAHQWEVLGATHDHAPLDPADELDEVLGRAVAQRVIDEHDRDGYDDAAEPRGYLTAITDSVAGTITPTWGPDGQLTSEQLPGGITLSIGYDPAQVPVSRSYTRTSDDELLWHDWTVDNHRGQQILHGATTGTYQYTYDRLGRLTQVKDDPANNDLVCATRTYTYDNHSNRTARTTVNADSTECPDHGTTTATSYVYDSADRLVSTSADGGGVWVYDPLGRTTSMPITGGALVNDYYVNDLVAAQTIDGLARYTWDLDPIQRRAANTQYEWVNNAWAESATKVSHYATDSDEPAWISEDVTNPADITRYVSGAEGDIAVTTSSTGDAVVQLVDLHGDVVGTVPIADNADQATWEALTLQRTDEFGAPQPLAGAGATTGPPRYGWLGAAQRSSEALGGVVLMGARLYSTTTGRFLTVDPVPGGSATAYDYCNADPINCTDLAGTFSLGGLLKAVAVVGEIASLVPGPVGAAAAGISAVAYAAQGNTSKALEMGVTAAAALVGCGAVVKVATRVGAAVKAGAMASRAAPKLERAAAMVKKVLPKVRDAATCALPNSFAPGTLVLLADGSLVPIEALQAGDEVWSTDTS
ncbi:MAG: hypothetical protein KQH57_10090 [Actinomycetales bacterium]|nr:hypothetical protein [Actinomycetales bacterium]